MLCFSPIVNHNDKNLVQGRGQFKVFEEISSFQFVVHCPSPYMVFGFRLSHDEVTCDVNHDVSTAYC